MRRVAHLLPLCPPASCAHPPGRCRAGCLPPPAPPAVSAQVDAKLAELGAASEAGLAEAAGRLQARLEEGCHTAHVALEKRMGEAAGACLCSSCCG